MGEKKAEPDKDQVMQESVCHYREDGQFHVVETEEYAGEEGRGPKWECSNQIDDQEPERDCRSGQEPGHEPTFHQRVSDHGNTSSVEGRKIREWASGALAGGYESALGGVPIDRGI
jgi:hypothetical protein